MNQFLRLLTPAFVLIHADAAQENWPRFLGPGGSNTGPAEAPLASLELKEASWQKELPGTGVSSPVVWGRKLFLTTELAGEEGRRAVICFDTETGAELWRLTDSFAVHGKHNFNSFASSTPALDAERLYISWTSGGEMHALAITHDGKKLWQQNLGPYSEDHGSGASPVLSGGSLIVVKDSTGVAAADSFITGLDPATGETRWKLARQSHRTPFATPLTIDHDGQPCVVLSSNPAALTCLRSKDGKVLWQVDNMVPQLRPVGSPGLADGVFFGAIGQGGTAKASIAVKLKEGKAERIWEGKKGVPYVPSIVSMGKNFLFLSDGGILTCVKAGDGETRWSERLFQDQAYSSPIVAGNHIYCIGRGGHITAAEATEAGCKIIATANLGDACDATPAFAGGRLFVRTRSHLMCLGAAKLVP